jgi:hypothetical protein
MQWLTSVKISIMESLTFRLYSKPWTTLFSPVTNNNFVSPDPVWCMGNWSHFKAGNDRQTEAWNLDELTWRQNKSKISCNVVLRCEMTKHLSRSEIWLPKNSSDKYITEKPVSRRRISKYGLSYFSNNSYALAGKFSKQCLKWIAVKKIQIWEFIQWAVSWMV